MEEAGIKRSFLLVLCLALIFCLSACGSARTGTTVTVEPRSQTDDFERGRQQGYEEGYAAGYKAGKSEAASHSPGSDILASVASPAGSEADYVLNTNTKKFHYPGCKSVSQMADKNKEFFTGSREEVIAMGYKPCGNCRP